MTRVWRNRMAIGMASVFLCGAVAIAYALTPEPAANTLGPGTHCHRVAGIFTTCSQ
jgi:hypothetical protein